jgi:hypothetical protein
LQIGIKPGVLDRQLSMKVMVVLFPAKRHLRLPEPLGFPVCGYNTTRGVPA